MKSSWWLGIIMAYMVILGWELVVTGGTSFSQNNFIAQQTTLSSIPILGDVISYVSTIGQALLLYSPSIFQGYMLWVWWFVCFPLDVMMVVGIVVVARGGSSS